MTEPLLTPAQTEFLAGRHYVSVATIDEDGAPRQAVAWYALQPDGRILLNSRHPRRWPRNLLRDGRVALAIADRDDGLRWLGITGVVDEVIEDVAIARDDIVALGDRYSDAGRLDAESEATFRGQQRITFLVRVTGIHDHLAG